MSAGGMRYVQRARRALSPGRAVTVLMYHSIHPVPHRFAISPAAFDRHLSLITSRYDVVRLKDLPSLMRGNVHHRRRVAITFDDAYGDFVEYALPALARADVPATVFVPTAFIGGVNEWDLASGVAPPRRILDARELRAVQASGLVDIGSHTVGHVRMAPLGEGEMRQQAQGSRAVLERLLGVPVQLFSYPYGMLDDFSPQSERVLAEAGYTVAVTAHWGTTNAAARLLALRRIFLLEDDDDATVAAKIEGAYDWIAIKERFNNALRSAWRLAGGAA
jgi:peptidoglycan/xylan/chitin deacetylase (PgdA/CDA1 family)